ncbi:hypothetical protein [Brucella intermedia]|uniref:hypothetical protein n=1 Tax=Brucella intermedia TaxID=94625 RepID=UPI00124E3F93|nr:hypothetical protein [Brucella intermedia]KAB2716979.1 hypothetical protein F9K75_12990 [Brucella intermedia]
MSVRETLNKASPELLKSPVSTLHFYEMVETISDTFAALRKRLIALEKREEEIKSLKSRLDALEEGGIKYRGIYQRAQDYSKGDVVTFNGCAWIALRSLKETEAPATCDGWILMVKKGRDA